jgi:hypothetical protein
LSLAQRLTVVKGFGQFKVQSKFEAVQIVQAVEPLCSVQNVSEELGIKAMYREVLETDGSYSLREPSEAYVRNFPGENQPLRSENTLPWNESLETPGR